MADLTGSGDDGRAMAPMFVTQREAAQALGRTRQTIARWLEDGRLTPVPAGRKLGATRVAVDEQYARELAAVDATGRAREVATPHAFDEAPIAPSSGETTS